MVGDEGRHVEGNALKSLVRINRSTGSAGEAGRWTAVETSLAGGGACIYPR
jgi:hypothetical protein